MAVSFRLHTMGCLGVVALGMLGPGLVLSGLASISEILHNGKQMDMQRAAKQRVFADALHQWNLTHRMLLAYPFRLGYRLTNTSKADQSRGSAPLDNNFRFIDLGPRQDHERLPASDLPPWKPLSLRGFKTALTPAHSLWHPAILHIKLYAHIAKTWIALGHAQVNWTSVKSTRSISMKECIMSRHGAVRAGTCTVFRVLSSLCLIANFSAFPLLQSSHLELGHSEKRCSTSYRTVSATHVRPDGVPTITPFGPITVSIFSKEDPLFTAVALTNGTFRLGSTTDEKRRSALWLVVVGLLLCLPPTGVACWACAVRAGILSNHARTQRVPTKDPMDSQ
ncbi:hypothetical protein AB1Y20_000459 [Prymnesium parvum]|uniref:Uncharacterized protein n=1 Tax=Prymnesium parvum TaxID=97485 RepID=A0AB34K8I1_PRYPA